MIQVDIRQQPRTLTRLRRWREEYEYSMRDLASLSGVSVGTIYRLEQGRSVAQPRTVRRLAQAFDIKPAELY